MTNVDVCQHVAMGVDEAWQEYHRIGADAARKALISHYVPLVRLVAARLGSGLPSNVDRDDLVSYGVFGLIDAIQRFDPERGVKFETYAVTRIRGSIIDELRALDWVPRSVRSKARDIERVSAGLETKLGRAPLEAEVAHGLGVSVAELRVLSSQGAVTTVGALDENGGEDGLSLGDLVSDAGANPEDQFVNGHEVTSMVARAVGGLPERSRAILVLYYLQEMTLAEIGQVLGVTESRVCQLQSRLLHELREALGQGWAAA